MEKETESRREERASGALMLIQPKPRNSRKVSTLPMCSVPVSGVTVPSDPQWSRQAL